MKKLVYLPLVLTLFSVPMAEDILIEGFEGGTIPSGWDDWEMESPYLLPWLVYTPGYGHTGDYAAIHGTGIYDPDSGFPGEDSWLVTPTLDMSGYQNLVFSCWYSEWFDIGYSPNVSIMGSDAASPDPSDFVEILDMGAPPSQYEQRYADASAFDGEPNVTFAVRYRSPGPAKGNYDPVLIDDVLISDEGMPGIESASLGTIKSLYK